MGRISPAICLGACVALASGCQTLLSPLRALPVPGMSDERITEEELHQEVLRLADRASAQISIAADAIALASGDRGIRRNALLWKVRVIPLAQQAASRARATEAFLALYTLVTAQRYYLVDGDGRSLFGDQQETARRASQEIESEFDADVSRILPAADAVRLDRQVEELAAANPIRGVFMLGRTESGFSKAETLGAFDWFLAAPMAPFRALQGVESGAAAIHEFNTTARQMGDIAAALPEQTRWQLELFLYDLEDRDTMVAALAAFQKVADASAQLSETAAELPHATRRELESLLADTSQSQENLRTTLAELRQTIASADGAVANARPLADSLERFAAQADEAGKSWSQLIAAVRGPGDKATARADARPFDIADYERAAVTLRETASELHELLAELQGAGGTSLLDALLWRALAFVAACFVLALLYRALAPRLSPRA